jgi:hypothetical protein
MVSCAKEGCSSKWSVTMKHIFRVASTALALLCTTGFAMAFIGVPPASGPGSVFYGNEEAAPLRDPALKQKLIPKQKSKKAHSKVQKSQPK